MSTNEIKSVFIKETVNMDRMDYYEDMMHRKEILEMKFSLADISGNLYTYDGDIRIQLNNTDINGTMYKAKYRANALANLYPVVVTSIDRDNKVVNVSHDEAKETTKEELLEEIEAALNANETLFVNAKITGIKGGVGSGYAFIDIGGVGILGVIRKKDWSTAFTSDLSLVAKRGDIIRVAIKKRVTWNGKPAYGCSRAEALGFDPWRGINNKLPKNTVVNVVCISKTPKNFFGKIEGIDEINAYCEYPDSERNIKIEVGKSYQGFVYAVNEATKLLRLRIFKQLDN